MNEYRFLTERWLTGKNRSTRRITRAVPLYAIQISRILLGEWTRVLAVKNRRLNMTRPDVTQYLSDSRIQRATYKHYFVGTCCWQAGELPPALLGGTCRPVQHKRALTTGCFESLLPNSVVPSVLSQLTVIYGTDYMLRTPPLHNLKMKNSLVFQTLCFSFFAVCLVFPSIFKINSVPLKSGSWRLSWMYAACNNSLFSLLTTGHIYMCFKPITCRDIATCWLHLSALIISYKHEWWWNMSLDVRGEQNYNWFQYGRVTIETEFMWLKT